MSSANVNRELAVFGSKMSTIAVMTVLIFIFNIIGWFIAFVGFISLILSIIVFFIFLSALGNIKEAGYGLNNRNLLEFRSKIIFAIVLGIIGSLFLIIGIVLLFIGFLIFSIIILVIGIIIFIIAAILKIQAWSRLETFFSSNMAMFPPNIGGDARSGANLCKIGAILDLTIILSIVGDILRIIGYFKLAKLKYLTGPPAPKPTVQPVPPQPAPAATTNFCPNCGSPIKPGESYCSECGSSIN